MEALQCIKCAIRHNLLFREPAPSSKLETEETTDGDDRDLENAGAGEDLERDEESDIEDFSWDGLLIEDDDDKAMYF